MEISHAENGKNEATVVSEAIDQANFGKLLRQVESERHSLVIEKGGTPRAVLLSIRDYVRLAAPEPEVLKAIGNESKRKGTDAPTSRKIDRIVEATRDQKEKR